jgi:hypothetical protein
VHLRRWLVEFVGKIGVPSSAYTQFDDDRKCGVYVLITLIKLVGREIWTCMDCPHTLITVVKFTPPIAEQMEN